MTFCDVYGLGKALEQSWSGVDAYYRLHCGNTEPQDLQEAIDLAGRDAYLQQEKAKHATSAREYRAHMSLSRWYKSLQEGIEEYAQEKHGKAWRDLLPGDDD